MDALSAVRSSVRDGGLYMGKVRPEGLSEALSVRSAAESASASAGLRMKSRRTVRVPSS